MLGDNFAHRHFFIGSFFHRRHTPTFGRVSPGTVFLGGGKTPTTTTGDVDTSPEEPPTTTDGLFAVVAYRGSSPSTSDFECSLRRAVDT
jgi:hypothetical protein